MIDIKALSVGIKIDATEVDAGSKGVLSIFLGLQLCVCVCSRGWHELEACR